MALTAVSASIIYFFLQTINSRASLKEGVYAIDGISCDLRKNKINDFNFDRFSDSYAVRNAANILLFDGPHEKKIILGPTTATVEVSSPSCRVRAVYRIKQNHHGILELAPGLRAEWVPNGCILHLMIKGKKFIWKQQMLNALDNWARHSHELALSQFDIDVGDLYALPPLNESMAIRSSDDRNIELVFVDKDPLRDEYGLTRFSTDGLGCGLNDTYRIHLRLLGTWDTE